MKPATIPVIEHYQQAAKGPDTRWASFPLDILVKEAQLGLRDVAFAPAIGARADIKRASFEHPNS